MTFTLGEMGDTNDGMKSAWRIILWFFAMLAVWSTKSKGKFSIRA